MNSQVNYIRQRLSFRKPLAEALELTSRLTDKLSLQKPPKIAPQSLTLPSSSKMMRTYSNGSGLFLISSISIGLMARKDMNQISL